jgi:hypothetical protein
MLIELAAADDQERRLAALTTARGQAKQAGCAAMLDYTLNACRRLVRSADGLRDHPGLDTLLAAVDGAVAAAILAGRIDYELAAILTAPQRALTSLLGSGRVGRGDAGDGTESDAQPGLQPQYHDRMVDSSLYADKVYQMI